MQGEERLLLAGQQPEPRCLPVATRSETSEMHPYGRLSREVQGKRQVGVVPADM